jgi:RND superfamily putative drug exporter
MTTITRWVLAHKRSVAAFWILVTLVGIATVSQATKAFSTEFTVPGREGFETNVAIARLYHQGGRNAPILPLVTLPAGTTVDSPGVRAGLDP